MYNIEVKKKALKQIKALPRRQQERIIAAFEMLKSNPFNGKKLSGEYEGAWSLHVWPYRILYTIHHEIVTVAVFRVGHRQGVYKK